MYFLCAAVCLEDLKAHVVVLVVVVVVVMYWSLPYIYSLLNSASTSILSISLNEAITVQFYYISISDIDYLFEHIVSSQGFRCISLLFPI